MNLEATLRLNSIEKKQQPLSYGWSLLGLLLFLSFNTLNAQEKVAEEEETKKKNPFELSLSESPKIKMTYGGYVQPMAQYTEWNPGSLDKNDNEKDGDFALAVRRLRLVAALYIGDRFQFHLTLGENNYNETGKDFPYIKLMDAYASYLFAKPFGIAIGKSTYDGLSRFTAPSPASILTTDIPLIAQPSINITDDITREFGLTFFGDIGKLNYRMVINRPFGFSYTGAHPGAVPEGQAQFTDYYNNLQFAPYVKYDVFDKEDNRSPNFAGTYLGKKHVLSIGIGAKYQHDALFSETQNTTTFHDMNLWAADIFWEHPVKADWAQCISGYAAYFDYDLGPNYIRNIGINNVASGFENTDNIYNGSGNNYPFMGSGQSVYMHLGLLLNNMGKQHDWGALQPYAAVQSSDFDALNSNMILWNLGVNWLLNGQNSKLSFDIQNRPVFSNITFKETDRKYMFVLQYQYMLH